MEKEKKIQQEPAPTEVGQRVISLTPFKSIILLILVLALFTRLVAIGIRPIHHDESMFAYYSYHWSQTGDYNYQPILHGPLMLYVTGATFWLFGDCDLTMRLSVVLMGIGLIMLVWGLRRWLTSWGAIAAMAFLVFSPGFMHYSRFFRHDVPLAFFYVLLVLAISKFFRKELSKWTIFYVVLICTFLITIKENSLILLFTFTTFTILALFLDLYQRSNPVKKPKGKVLRYMESSNFIIGGVCALIVTLFLWIGYFATAEGTLEIFKTRDFIAFRSPFWQYFALLLLLGILTPLFALIRLYILKDKEQRLLFTRVWLMLRNHWILLVLGLIVSWCVYVLIFNNFFSNERTFLQIYRDTFNYWWGQHKEHRIKGEFHYYMVLLFLYELPALIFIFIGGIKDLLKKKWILYGLIPGYFLLVLIVALSFSGVKINAEFWDKTFHLTSKWHIFFIFTISIFGSVLTIVYFLEHHRFRAFLLWWFFVSLLIYSYAGEKVPWVSIHISIPLVLLAGSYLGEFIHSRTFLRRPIVWSALLGVLLLWQARSCIFLCFYNYDSARERMNYAQTVRDTKKVAEEIHRLSFLLEKEQTRVIIKGEAIWPLRWYMRNHKNWTEYENIETTKAPLVVLDWKEAEESKNIQDNYRVSKYFVRSWWQPRSASLKVLPGIWRWLFPGQYREDPQSETAKLLQSSIDEWKKIGNWILFRKTFDHYGSQWPTFTTVDFAFCIRKDVLF